MAFEREHANHKAWKLKATIKSVENPARNSEPNMFELC